MKKPLKTPTLNLEHLTSSYPLQSIVVKYNQIEWDNHFKPRENSIGKEFIVGGNHICILQQLRPLICWKNTVRKSRNIPQA
jgi:hypothetical protein